MSERTEKEYQRLAKQWQLFVKEMTANRAASYAQTAALKTALEALEVIGSALPLMGDPNASPEDECIEVPVTWAERYQILAAIATIKGAM